MPSRPVVARSGFSLAVENPLKQLKQLPARLKAVRQRSDAQWDTAFTHAAVRGLFAGLRTRHDADRSVGNVAAFLAEPQYATSRTSSSLH